MIAQPVNTTVCVGETAMFTCVLDIQNVSMDMRRNYYVRWCRTRIDENFHASNISIPQRGTPRFNITNTISNNTLTSFLNITDVIWAHRGPYWLKWNNEDISNMAFLSITSNGTYVRMCMYVHVQWYNIIL